MPALNFWHLFGAITCYYLPLFILRKKGAARTGWQFYLWMMPLTAGFGLCALGAILHQPHVKFDLGMKLINAGAWATAAGFGLGICTTQTRTGMITGRKINCERAEIKPPELTFTSKLIAYMLSFMSL